MNKRKALERRRALSPQARQAIKRFEALRLAERKKRLKEHQAKVELLRAELKRDLAEVTERYAKSIDAVKRGDSSGILVATEVPS